ncbi:glycoprotein-N-acetylgalactosamine 3-beta-galactosyltransferase 1-like [Rhynchophorus ferrugineus]|uniref:Glycoprotein-N-acetylgalactosamine 3-beta-galactosyltransferase 1 n=1 Tax=Rhynchophorus ferrugineus TaxID=354439 RepID=A0A834I508_RHYFE|nr:hypothetical protein GWI33_014505 [Rhynchophorus ferrugineus]
MSYVSLRRVHRPSIQPFLTGAVVGVLITVMLFTATSLDPASINFSIFSSKRETILRTIGDHSHHDHHHKMLNTSLSETLYEKVRVLCWIMTGPKNHKSKAQHVKATWGRRCNILIFMSTETDHSLPAVALPVIENRDNLWGKTKEAFKYVYENYYEKADWFFKGDDDTYAIMENMRYMLNDYNSSDPIYFGFRMKPYVSQGYMSGGGGYVLSKESVKRFVTEAIPNPEKCKSDNTGAEDVEIGRCLEAVGVKAGDSRDTEGRSRFLPLFLTDLLIPGAMDSSHWFWQYTYYPFEAGLECCSDNLITIHYVGPYNLYLLEYLIYHVQPFGIGYSPTLTSDNKTVYHNLTEQNKTVDKHKP